MSAETTGQNEMMLAVIQRRYGTPDVLELTRTVRPAPKENEVLVRIHATTVTATEAVFRRGKPYISRLFTGLRKPRMQTLGEEFAGEVVAVGATVTKFNRGDRVFGTAGPAFGAAAEYLCLSENEAIVPKPTDTSFEEAAASVDGFLTALPFLRDKGIIRSGLRVLINGASGSVGSAAVQVAKYYGAEVTGVCSSANVDLVKSLGADHVIDYTTADFTSSRDAYDIIFDTVGKTTFRKCRRSLRSHGVFLEAGMNMGILGSVLLSSLFGHRKAKIAATGLRPTAERIEDLKLLRELMANGTIVPVIDRIHPLEEIADAHRYVDTGHKKGNVVIRVAREEQRHD
jgi:NADPH:quinone reductase-like Zn-dependent oxidoreductase